MEQLAIVREGREWSRWNAAMFIVDSTLESSGLETDGSWIESADMRVFVGTSSECEAVASVLGGKGLRLERQSTGPDIVV